MIQQHSDIQAQIEDVRVELVDILNTPHGQRDQFPKK
jgi:phage baseplate assembly protein W